jgi:putative ABC transport system substrate-binding protein
MKRREFIAMLGGAAAAWPLAAHAQQGERLRRIGILMGWDQNDPERLTSLTAFREALRKLGWIEGRNVLIDYRWIGSDPGRASAFAAELVGFAPDVLLTTHTPLAKALQNRSRTIPIVFATLSNPVGSGLVSNLARPGDNVTGFTGFEYLYSP